MAQVAPGSSQYSVLSWQASLGSQHHQLCHQDLQFLIPNQVAPSHGPPEGVLSPLFFPASSLLHSSKLLRESSTSLLHHAFWPPKLCGKGRPKAAWFPSLLGCHSGYKSQHQSSSAAPFATPPTIGYTCQHSRFLGFFSSFSRLP